MAALQNRKELAGLEAFASSGESRNLHWAGGAVALVRLCAYSDCGGGSVIIGAAHERGRIW